MSDEEEEWSNNEDQQEEDYDVDDYADDGFGEDFDFSGDSVQEHQRDKPLIHEEAQDLKIRADMAVMLKDQGNEFFRKGDMEAALRCYSSALEHDDNNGLLYLNKAACYSKLNQPSSVLDQANLALQKLEGKNVKAWFRRGMAFESLGDLMNALFDYREAVVLEPQNADVKPQLAALEKKVDVIYRSFSNTDPSRDESYWFDHFPEIGRTLYLSADTTLDVSLPEPERERLTNKDEPLLVCLFWLMKGNATVTNLVVSNREIDTRAAFSLKAMITQNRVLTHLDLSNTKLGAYGMELLAKGLQNNQTILHLNLSNCFIRRFGCEFLARALKQHPSLEYVNLHANAIRNRGVLDLVQNLADNFRLKFLDLSCNWITTEGAMKIASFLNQEDRALRKIVLWGNSFSMKEMLLYYTHDTGVELELDMPQDFFLKDNKLF